MMLNIAIKIRNALRKIVRIIGADFLEDISRIQQFNLSTAAMHRETFAPFKHKHTGEDLVVVACGPSVNDFKYIPGAKYIGVNHAIRIPNLKLDYLFLVDSTIARLNPGEMNEYNNYCAGTCTKFYGISGDFSATDNRDWVPSESDVVKAHALRFRTDNLINMRIEHNSKFVYDISTQPLPDFGSVVFSALEFALWTNPRRLYLVGCDCTTTGHFDNIKDKAGLPPVARMREIYNKFKIFANTHYRDTEIISVNPVGLKGIFKDWYQKNGPLD